MHVWARIFYEWRCVFVSALQLVEAPLEIGVSYDGCTSGQRIYAYVDGNPLSMTDPLGLQRKPKRDGPGLVLQGVVNCITCQIPGVPDSRQTGVAEDRFGNVFEIYNVNGMSVAYHPATGGTQAVELKNGVLETRGTVDLGYRPPIRIDPNTGEFVLGPSINIIDPKPKADFVCGPGYKR